MGRTWDAEQGRKCQRHRIGLMGVAGRMMRLDPSLRTRGDLMESFRPAEIAFQVARNGSKARGLAAHLGNVGYLMQRWSYFACRGREECPE
jgi:hypothetical protein